MKRVTLVMLMLAALVSGGCSNLKGISGEGPSAPSLEKPHKPPVEPVPLPQLVTPEGQLGLARDLIRSGNDDAARELLQKVGAEKTIPGVTDEALFHLGLLSLKEETEASEFPQTRQILERLIRDYPGSIWAVQATPLNDLLVGRWLSEISLGKARRQVKALKDSNLSLTRENKEMRLNIEKLKSLEQELEQKSRR
jgi:hypothetical protein